MCSEKDSTEVSARLRTFLLNEFSEILLFKYILIMLRQRLETPTK